MSNSNLFRWAILLVCLGAGCALPFKLKTTTDVPEKVGEREVETVVTPTCVFQAGQEKSTLGELLAFVKLTNKGKQPFEFDPTMVELSGNKDVVRNSPIRAVNPEAYAKELSASADVYDQRTKMETYQGIEGLGSLNEGKSDREIEAAKRQYESKQKDAKKAAETANDLRARAAMIQTTGLKKSTVKPGESIEGPIAFKANDLVGRGAVSLTIPSGPCAGELRFLLAR